MAAVGGRNFGFPIDLAHRLYNSLLLSHKPWYIWASDSTGARTPLPLSVFGLDIRLFRPHGPKPLSPLPEVFLPTPLKRRSASCWSQYARSTTVVIFICQPAGTGDAKLVTERLLLLSFIADYITDVTDIFKQHLKTYLFGLNFSTYQVSTPVLWLCKAPLQ